MVFLIQPKEKKKIYLLFELIKEKSEDNIWEQKSDLDELGIEPRTFRMR